jgi:hypothetical protein
VLNRAPIISEQDLHLAQFALGAFVKNDQGGNGVVRAIFTTKEGELVCVVEKEGALDFVDETKLLPNSSAGLAA